MMRISCIGSLLVTYLVVTPGASHTIPVPAINQVLTRKHSIYKSPNDDLQIFSPRKHDEDHRILRRSRSAIQTPKPRLNSQAFDRFEPQLWQYDRERLDPRTVRHAKVPLIAREEPGLYARASEEGRDWSPSRVSQPNTSRSPGQSAHRQDSIPHPSRQQAPVGRTRVHLIQPLTLETLAQQKLPNGRHYGTENNSRTVPLAGNTPPRNQQLPSEQRSQPGLQHSFSSSSLSSSHSPPSPPPSPPVVSEARTQQRDLQRRWHKVGITEQQGPSKWNLPISPLNKRASSVIVDSDGAELQTKGKSQDAFGGRISPISLSSGDQSLNNPLKTHSSNASAQIRGRSLTGNTSNASRLVRRGSKKGSKANSRSSSAQSLQSASSAKGSSTDLRKTTKSPSTSSGAQRPGQRSSSAGASSSSDQGAQSTKKRKGRRKSAKSSSQSLTSEQGSTTAVAGPSASSSGRKQQNTASRSSSPTGLPSRLSPIRTRVGQSDRLSRSSSTTTVNHPSLDSPTSSSARTFYSTNSDLFDTPSGSSRSTQTSPFGTSPLFSTAQTHTQRLNIAPSPFSNARPALSTSVPGSPSHERARPFHNAHSRSYSAPVSMMEGPSPGTGQPVASNTQTNRQTSEAQSRKSSQELPRTPSRSSSGNLDSATLTQPSSPFSTHLSPPSTPEHPLGRQNSGRASSSAPPAHPATAPASASTSPNERPNPQTQAQSPPREVPQSQTQSLGQAAYQAWRNALDPVVARPGPSRLGPIGSPTRGSPVRGSPVRGSPVHSGLPSSSSTSNAADQSSSWRINASYANIARLGSSSQIPQSSASNTNVAGQVSSYQVPQRRTLNSNAAGQNSMQSSFSITNTAGQVPNRQALQSGASSINVASQGTSGQGSSGQGSSGQGSSRQPQPPRRLDFSLERARAEDLFSMSDLKDFPPPPRKPDGPS